MRLACMCVRALFFHRADKNSQKLIGQKRLLD